MGAIQESLQESLPLGAIYNNPQQLFLSLTGALTLAAAATKSIEVVHKGEMGVKTYRGDVIERRGRTEEEIAEIGRYVTLGPGIYPVLPLLQKVVKINVQDRLAKADPFDLESSDGQLFQVTPQFIWRVRADGDNPHDALFKVKNEKDNKDVAKDHEIQQIVVGLCVDGLHRVLRGMTALDLKNVDSREVGEETKNECREDLLEYGTELRRLILPPVTPKDSEVLKQGLERIGITGLGAVAVDETGASENTGGILVSIRPPHDVA